MADLMSLSEIALSEGRVLRNPRSIRNIEVIGRDFGLSREEFIKVLEGKVVLDVGSGYNGLAIDAYLRNLNSVIVSVDPIISEISYEQAQQEALARARQRLFPDFTEEQMEVARTETLKRAHPYFAHKMPGLKDGQFDLIIDHHAVFGYFQDEREIAAFLRTVKEEQRVLKEGSVMYVADFVYYCQEFPEWKERLLMNLGISYKLMDTAFSILIQT